MTFAQDCGPGIDYSDPFSWKVSEALNYSAWRLSRMDFMGSQICRHGDEFGLNDLRVRVFINETATLRLELARMQKVYSTDFETQDIDPVTKELISVKRSLSDKNKRYLSKVLSPNLLALGAMISLEALTEWNF